MNRNDPKKIPDLPRNEYFNCGLIMVKFFYNY